jgi:curli biogenesis system outer membrane secretion channel CsgG
MMKRCYLFLLVLILSICWLTFPQGTHAQGKMRVAVTKFENKVKNPWWDKSWDIGDGLAEMLTTELFKTGRVIVLERAAVSDVVGEQQLGQTGLLRQETAAQTGQMIGAQVVIRGAVTEFAQQASGSRGGISTRYFGLGGSTENAHVALDIRLIDASTGQVIASTNASAKAASSGISANIAPRGFSFGGDAFNSTPLGQATREAISKAVAFILERTPTQAQALAVVKVEGDQVFINAGASENIRVGDRFTVHSKGEDLIDPTTGLKLGSSQRQIGTIEVVDVQEKFSIATITNGRGIKRGDAVKIR